MLDDLEKVVSTARTCRSTARKVVVILNMTIFQTNKVYGSVAG
jgi:hypothetical protein